MHRWAIVLAFVAAWGCSDTVTTHSGASGGGGVGGDACNCSVGAYVPVCGEDGQTYDAACGEQCVSVTIACQGECPCVDCDAIEVEYAAALADAKECAPQLSIALCTEFVDDQVACPCMGAFVNPQNVSALAVLDVLKDEWASGGCGALVDCPAIGCVQPTQGFCLPDATGMSGSCGINP